MSDIRRVEGMLVNRAKVKLAAGGHAIGAYVGTIRNPALMRILANLDYDFVWLDTSHASYSWELLGNFCDMARASGLVPILRPYDTSAGIAQRMLDIGAMGLIYPDVGSRAQTRTLGMNLRFPPAGHRGAVGPGGPSMDYSRGGALTQSAVRRHIDDNTLFAIQVENIEAIESLDDILEEGGVDVVEVGRTDLSASLGVPSELRHPKVLSALRKVVDACARHGAAPGAGCYSPEDAQEMIGCGMRWLTYSTDLKLITQAYVDGKQLLGSLIERHRQGA